MPKCDVCDMSVMSEIDLVQKVALKDYWVPLFQ